MRLTNVEQHQFSKLVEYRDDINRSIFHMERILKEYFPKEYSLAHQHWIPQIITALYKDDRWLSRGEYCIQDTIDHINDYDNGSGVNKYI